MNDMAESGIGGSGARPSWRALYLAGLSGIAAARARGVSGAAASKWAAGYGLSWMTHPDQRVDPAARRLEAGCTDWASLHARGLTLAQAAAIAGKSHGAAWSWAAAQGVSWPVDPASRTARHVAQADAIARSMPPVDDSEISAVDCRELWAAVLMSEWRAVFPMDIYASRRPSRVRQALDVWHRAHLDQQEASSTRARNYERRKAEQWFGTKDFRMVCELAGVDPDFVLMRFRAALAARDDRARATGQEMQA